MSPRMTDTDTSFSSRESEIEKLTIHQDGLGDVVGVVSSDDVLNAQLTGSPV